MGETVIKLDTGSPVTIMTVRHLSLILKCSISRILRLLSSNNGIKRHSFKSYTGDDISAVLCRLCNVKIGDTVVSNFYFYLNLDTKARGNALIGVDFIRCCSISACIDGSINLNYCSEVYTLPQQDVLEIDEILFTSFEESSFDSFMSGASQMSCT